jgi:hypothetical protein
MKITSNNKSYFVKDESGQIEIPRKVVAALIHNSMLFQLTREMRQKQSLRAKHPSNKGIVDDANFAESKVDRLITRIIQDAEIGKEGTHDS